jgi:hypothetical protein
MKRELYSDLRNLVNFLRHNFTERELHHVYLEMIKLDIIQDLRINSLLRRDIPETTSLKLAHCIKQIAHDNCWDKHL